MPHTASLTTSIAFAHDRLKRARQDGDVTQIQFWCQRRDELLDEFNARKFADEAQNPVATAIGTQS